MTLAAVFLEKREFIIQDRTTLLYLVQEGNTGDVFGHGKMDPSTKLILFFVVKAISGWLILNTQPNPYRGPSTKKV